MKITHDFHIHTALSVCAKDSATVEHYRDVAREQGLNSLGFADHFWDEKCGEPWNNFYARQGLEHVLELKKEIAAVKEKQMRFRTDREFVESLARENRRAFPGELVFIFDN